MPKTCRTCTQNLWNHDYFYLNGISSICNNLLLKDVLLKCIPEMKGLENHPGLAICRNCMSSLHISYSFKIQTLKNEEVLRNKRRTELQNLYSTKKYLGEAQPTARSHSNNSGIGCSDAASQTFELKIDSIAGLKTEVVYNSADFDETVELVSENLEPIYKTKADRRFSLKPIIEQLLENQNSSDSPKDEPDVHGYLKIDLRENVPSTFVEGKGVPPSQNVDFDAAAMKFSHLDADVGAEEVVTHDGGSADLDDTFLQDANSFSGADSNCSDFDESNEQEEKFTPDLDKDPTINTKSVTEYFDVQRKGGDRSRRNVNRPYKCSECQFRSDHKASLDMHRRIHTGEKPFHCTKCLYRAKRKSHLENHMKIHTGERPFQCMVCQKSFITKQLLKNHSLIHTGEKPYRCTKCSFQTRHKLSICNHVKRFHIGYIKPSQRTICYICGKCLAGHASLSSHMRIHTGVKSHLCELCGKYFREKGMLKNHLRVHTGDKPFKCADCDYIATRKAHLEDHKKTHLGNPELVHCTLCGKRYPTKLLLKKHKREAHTCKLEVTDEVKDWPDGFTSVVNKSQP